MGVNVSNINNVSSKDNLDDSEGRLYLLRRRRSLNQLFFDEQRLLDISKRAVELCPFSDFCLVNGTTTNELLGTGVSCCKSCYCDVGCGARMDCCFDFLDDTKLVEKHNLKCVSPRIPSPLPTDDKPIISGYFMIDMCSGNDSYNCTKETASVVGALFPVYSPSNEMFYFNRHCAICNGVNDTIDWRVYVSCTVANGFVPDLLSDGLRHGDCQVQFLPPKMVDADKFICHTSVITTCDTTEIGLDNNATQNNLKEYCESARATVVTPWGHVNTIFVNIF